MKTIKKIYGKKPRLYEVIIRKHVYSSIDDSGVLKPIKKVRVWAMSEKEATSAIPWNVYGSAFSVWSLVKRIK